MQSRTTSADTFAGRIINAVAVKSPAAIPPLLPVIVCPVSVTTVQLVAAETRDRMIMIGMIQINRKKVVSRSSFRVVDFQAGSVWLLLCDHGPSPPLARNGLAAGSHPGSFHDHGIVSVRFCRPIA